MDFLIEILIAAAGGLLAKELWSDAAPASQWLVRKAVKRLPKKDQERCGEEWLADLNDVPGALGKLLWAGGCHWAATVTSARAWRIESKSAVARLGSKIIDKAVEQLPVDKRETFREEWLCYLEETPGIVRKIFNALSCYLIAPRLAKTFAPHLDQTVPQQEPAALLDSGMEEWARELFSRYTPATVRFEKIEELTNWISEMRDRVHSGVREISDLPEEVHAAVRLAAEAKVNELTKEEREFFVEIARRLYPEDFVPADDGGDQ